MSTNPFDTMPPWALVVLGIVALAQLGFEIYALVDMLKRPSDQLALGGRKWLWAIIILLINWVGAIVYLVAGRKPALAVDVAPTGPVASRAASAADALYGPRTGSGRS